MDDLIVRPAVPEDAVEICRLLNAVDVAEIGRPETDLSSVQSDLAHPETDLAQDSWLGFWDGRLVAYALLWDDSGAERIDIDHYILPEHQDAGEQLLELAQARAVQRAVANGADRAVVHLRLNIRPTLDTSLLTRRGWQAVRRYNVLTRPLSPPADPSPALPPGLTVRDCRDEADRRRAHELAEETFAEHYDHQQRSYRQWLDDLGVGIDWSLVWIASLDGSGDVAVLLTRDDREAMGWISLIGVRKEARARGLGSHLLRHAFAAYADRGRDIIGLGVDTGNVTGALRLYEAHGMTLHFAVDTWEVTLRADPPARPDGRG
ncbi:GNAT family N-acetyltransferase [Streptomyces sp. NBC_01142]|uniref:GNAT family N-acetyltransferase n=1 Tax=Streptomyces sp. NBC_01142 TaxID=2975865 RepID=UPI00225B0402|nr:GNAT family N-acetyltransferase [Streptomyces sp. NBC_01142]MCX4819162.1 GNAT family N-acetyltransferase [Streptomyces sp. NBC_01142]